MSDLIIVAGAEEQPKGWFVFDIIKPMTRICNQNTNLKYNSPIFIIWIWKVNTIYVLHRSRVRSSSVGKLPCDAGGPNSNPDLGVLKMSHCGTDRSHKLRHGNICIARPGFSCNNLSIINYEICFSICFRLIYCHDRLDYILNEVKFSYRLFSHA